MTDRRLIAIPVGVFVLAALAAALRFPLREVAIAAFLLVGPGAAVGWLAGIRSAGTWLALVVPVSLSIDALIVTALTYAGVWSPELALGLIAGLTVLLIALVPFERGARAALIAVALLGALVLVAAELAPEAAAADGTRRAAATEESSVAA